MTSSDTPADLGGPKDERGRTVAVERTVDCPFSYALDVAQHVLATLSNQGGALQPRDSGRQASLPSLRLPLRRLFLLRLGLPKAAMLTRNVTVDVERRSDDTEAGRQHDELSVDWRANSRWLPDLHGLVQFRIAPTVQTKIRVTGTYRPPFGVPGRIFDSLLGRHWAAATVEDLLDRLTAELLAEYKRYVEASSKTERQAR